MSAAQYSRFPAAVKSDRRAERRAAIVVRDGVATLAVIVPRQGVQVVETFEVDRIETANRITMLVEPDGTTWTVGKGDGCGCASPLRTWYNAQLGSPARSGS